MAKLEIGNFLVKTIFFFFEKDFGEKERPLKKKGGDPKIPQFFVKKRFVLKIVLQGYQF